MRKFLSRLGDWILPFILLELAFMYQLSFGHDPWTWMAVYCFSLFVLSAIYIVRKQMRDTKNATSFFSAIAFMIVVVAIACLVPMVIKLVWIHLSNYRMHGDLAAMGMSLTEIFSSLW